MVPGVGGGPNPARGPLPSALRNNTGGGRLVPGSVVAASAGAATAFGGHSTVSMDSSSGSDLTNDDGSGFLGFIKQSSVRRFSTGLGPVRLVHVATDDEGQPVVIAGGDCDEDQPLLQRVASAGAGGNMALLRDGRSDSPSVLGEPSTPPPSGLRSATLRTPTGTFCVPSPGVSTPMWAAESKLRGVATTSPSLLTPSRVGYLEVWEAALL